MMKKHISIMIASMIYISLCAMDDEHTVRLSASPHIDYQATSSKNPVEDIIKASNEQHEVVIDMGEEAVEMSMDDVAKKLGFMKRPDTTISKKAHKKNVLKVLEHFKDSQPHEWSELMQQLQAGKTPNVGHAPHTRFNVGVGDIKPVTDYLAQEIFTEDIHVLGHEVTKQTEQKWASAITCGFIYIGILAWDIYQSSSCKN